jgi:hypothetical protein
MTDNVYVRMLGRAVEVEGSSQAVAHILHVPERTLQRWREGRAQMPWKAFLRLVEYLLAAEQKAAPPDARGSAAAAAPAAGEHIRFPAGELLARCARCDGDEFRRAKPTEPLRMTSRLVCCACGREALHSDLLVSLGRDLVAHAKAQAAHRARLRGVRQPKPVRRPMRSA